MTLKIIYPLILVIFCITNLVSQQMITNINSLLEIETVQIKTIESLFTLSTMPKIQAEIEITEDRVADVKAINKLHVVKLMMIINVKDIFDEKFVAAKNFIFTGSGKTEKEALRNAFSKIGSSGNSVKNFLEKTNNFAVNSSCDQGAQKIDQWINEGKTQKALRLAQQIAFYCPQYVQLYEKSFAKIQAQDCEKYLMNSKAYAANKDFEKSIMEVLKISPGSNCFQDVKTQLDAISKDYDLQKDRLYRTYQDISTDKQKFQEFIISLILQNNN